MQQLAGHSVTQQRRCSSCVEHLVVLIVFTHQVAASVCHLVNIFEPLLLPCPCVRSNGRVLEDPLDGCHFQRPPCLLLNQLSSTCWQQLGQQQRRQDQHTQPLGPQDHQTQHAGCCRCSSTAATAASRWCPDCNRPCQVRGSGDSTVQQSMLDSWLGLSGAYIWLVA